MSPQPDRKCLISLTGNNLAYMHKPAASHRRHPYIHVGLLFYRSESSVFQLKEAGMGDDLKMVQERVREGRREEEEEQKSKSDQTTYPKFEHRSQCITLSYPSLQMMIY